MPLSSQQNHPSYAKVSKGGDVKGKKTFFTEDVERLEVEDDN
jgi:hypothetical protein